MHTPRILSVFLVISLSLFAYTAKAAGEIFDFEVLRYKAKMLATKPYEQRTIKVPDWLLDPQFSYDQYREIRFKPDQAWWLRENLPFQLQFFHPGFVHKQTVQIAELENKKADLIEFSRDLFDYGHNQLKGTIPSNMGFSGLRIHYALNNPNYRDELVVFQGASYFRALCAKAVYGLSARGLAIDTAEPTGEEFPDFEEFWVEKPAPGAKEITVYALLNSKSVTGAYRIVIRPGTENSKQGVDTVMHVKCALFLRREVKVLGIAPLTSMFWHGEISTDHFGDFRPEVHDSDGLMISHAGGEWLWRPLDNPKTIQSSAFADQDPRGFGLVQRDRQYTSYEDLEAKYHQRPSAYVETIGSWGKGFVRLVEIPTPDETNDNIVAFWQPEFLPPIGEAIVFEYRLHWFLDQVKPPAGTVIGTRTGRSKTHEADLQRFIIDFDSPWLQRQAR